MNLIDYSYMTIRLFVLRIGKTGGAVVPLYRIVYGVVKPTLSKMSKLVVGQASSVGSCENGKLAIRKVVWADDKDVVLGIFDDLGKGVSLKSALTKWGIDTTDLDFDVSYLQEAEEKPWGIENILDRQLTYTRTVCMLNPEELLSKDGNIPSDADTALKNIEKFLAKETALPFGAMYDHVGNLNLIVEPDRDEHGKPLIESVCEKGKPYVQHVKVSDVLLNHANEVSVNVRFVLDNRVVMDSLLKDMPQAGQDIEFLFETEECPDAVEIKVWISEQNECRLVHHSMYSLLKAIHYTIGITGETIRVKSDFLEKLRENASMKNKTDIDDAETIERSSKTHSVVGAPITKKVRRKKRKVYEKTNDEYFPNGWKNVDNEHGMLSFLKWFKKKADGAAGVFLQDPYFEDVALYFIASADASCEYTVLTQTKLKTNSDGRESFSKEDGINERKNRILGVAKSYPTLFAPMKLVIKDVTSSHNALHDRYLFFDYGGGRLEGYSLSNSLQGATTKQPLLITQIGGIALEKVKQHIEEITNGREIELIYDFRVKAKKENDDDESEGKEVADKGFLTHLRNQQKKMVKGEVVDILLDIKNWKRWEKLSTLGYFLATTEPSDAYEIKKNLTSEMRKDSSWVEILKDFILRGHYSEYPIGYIHCPCNGYIHNDCTRLMSMEHSEIVNHRNARMIDSIGCEGNTFRVYGQYYAAKFLLAISPSVAVEVLKLFRPTLLRIDADRTIYPVHKVSLMLMTEILKKAIWDDYDDTMRILMTDTEAWCRGMGALMMLYKATNEDFDCEDYLGLVKDPEEKIVLCLAAWGMKPQPADKRVFYNALVEVFGQCGDGPGFTNRLMDLLEGVYFVEDKVEYIKKVASPLISKGLVDKDILCHEMIDRLFDESVVGEHTYMMRSVLPECLYLLGGNLSPVYDMALVMLKKYRATINSMAVHNDDNIFFASKDCVSLRIFLIVLLKRYEGSADGEIVKLRDLLAELDAELDAAGMKETKEEYQKLDNI